MNKEGLKNRFKFFPTNEKDGPMKLELENRFTYHPPKGIQLEKYEFIRYNVALLASEIDKMVPECREKSIAITKLEEAVMWANAGIARREK